MPLQLRLRAWQAHADVSFQTQRPVALIAGANASGKTAILDGVELALLGTGKLRGVKTKGELALKSIRDDAAETEVIIGWPGATIERTMDRAADQAVTVNGTTYKVTRGDAKIRDALGLEPEQLRAALEADQLLAGDENARRRTLFQASGAAGGTDRLAVELEQTGLPGEDIGRLVDLATADGFKEAQKYSEGQRAARASRLREPVIEAPEARYNAEWAGREIRLDQINLEDLGSRERELEELLKTVTKQVGVDRGTLAARLQQAKDLHTGLIEEGAELSRQVPEDVDAIRASAQAKRQEANAVGEDLRGQAAQIETLREQARFLETLEIGKPDVCPAIPGAPKCPMSKAKLDAHRKKLAEGREEILLNLESAEEQRANTEVHHIELESKAKASETALERADDIAERLEQIKVDLDDAEGAVANAKTALNVPEAEPSADREAELESRLDNLRQLTSAKRTFETQHIRAEADVEQRRKKEAERTAWDAAAKLLGPSGLPSQLFGNQIPMLQDFIDEFGIAEIRVTPDVALEAKVDGRWRSRTQLSESWRLRLSMAASHMVARTAGFPLLILDRFDHLDGAGRQAGLAAARRVAPHYLAGVLILATLQLEKPTALGLPDVETFWLHDGGLERIG